MLIQEHSDRARSTRLSLALASFRPAALLAFAAPTAAGLLNFGLPPLALQGGIGLGPSRPDFESRRGQTPTGGAQVLDQAPSALSRFRPNSRSSIFRPDIEGLRGIAVLIVVLFHCGVPGFTGGFAGVDVFFVLSGYLITGLLVNEVQKTSRLNLSNFYARRVRRLLPASALTLVVTLLMASVILAPQELMFTGRAARATALYVSNIFFAINGADYFAPEVKSNPLLHTWSLAVEEQFYLFWPLLIIVGLQLWRSKRALLAVLSALTIMSLAASVWFTARGGTFAFYELPARAWEFGIGGLAVLLPRGILKLSSRWWAGFGWLGIFAIVGSAYFIRGTADFPGWIALFPVLGTTLALVAGAEQPHRGASILLDTAPLQMLGLLSYSWYLWHWPFLVFSKAILPGISVAMVPLNGLIKRGHTHAA